MRSVPAQGRGIHTTSYLRICAAHNLLRTTLSRCKARARDAATEKYAVANTQLVGFAAVMEIGPGTFDRFESE